MKIKNSLRIATVSLVGLIASTCAVCSYGQTFRTTAVFFSAEQDSDASVPTIDTGKLLGSDLVNLAMGRSLTNTDYPNQVLALTFACDFSSLAIVVYDQSLSNIVTTIGISTELDMVENLGPIKSNVVTTIAASTELEAVENLRPVKMVYTNDYKRFVGQIEIAPNGNETHGLLGGFFTMEGRINIDPLSGCPAEVTRKFREDKMDKNFFDTTNVTRYERDPQRLLQETGRGHLIGVLNVFSDGVTNNVQVPFGAFSIRGARTVPGP